MKNVLPLFFVAFLGCLTSCNNHEESAVNDEPGKEISTEITITAQQFDHGKMRIGDPTPHKFYQTIKANAYVAPSLSGWARVSTPISGRVKSINFKVGDSVRKGQLLFSVESSEIILLQQKYAESYAQLKVIQKSYDRQKALFKEKVTSEKEFLKAESEYTGILVKLESLKAQLELINIDPQKVENGNISPSASVYAPINGFIAGSDLVPGQFIGVEKDVLELIDADQFQLNIHVFERDLKDVSIGQAVDFYDPNNTDIRQQAILTQVGKSIDHKSKTVQCIAKILPGKEELVDGLFVEAEIITCEREALAIPAGAFVEKEGICYVMVLKSKDEEKMIFEKTPIETGVKQNGIAEVLEEGVENILLEGGYNILMQE